MPPVLQVIVDVPELRSIVCIAVTVIVVALVIAGVRAALRGLAS